MGTTTRWGILAPGTIAHQFARGLRAVPDAELVAVGSRSIERAAAFAHQYDIANVHGTYEALVEDPTVDAIYVANPHNYHRDSAILCLEHGKAVLCEKPFTVSADGAQQILAAARKAGVFAMEAMWTRFLPAMQQARAWIDDGRIGDVRMVDASFAFRGPWEPEGRLLNPKLAGGSLLDVGVYVVSFAYWVTGRNPVSVLSQAHIGETGVDEQATILFRYEDGALARLACGIRTNTQHRAAVYGTEGWIEFPTSFWNGTTAVLHVGDEEQRFERPHMANGYEYEAIEVSRCLAEGKVESEIMPLDETLRIMRTLDVIRGQWNLVYPFEDRS